MGRKGKGRIGKGMEGRGWEGNGGNGKGKEGKEGKRGEWEHAPNGIFESRHLWLRNRASAMHFFAAKLLSIAIMTYYGLSPPKPTSGKFVTHTANIQHATAAGAHDARLHVV